MQTNANCPAYIRSLGVEGKVCFSLSVTWPKPLKGNTSLICILLCVFLRGPLFSILVCWFEEYKSGSLFYSSLSLSQVAKKSFYGTIQGSSKKIPKLTRSSWVFTFHGEQPPAPLLGTWLRAALLSRSLRHQGKRKLASVRQWLNVFILLLFSSVHWNTTSNMFITSYRK